MIVSICHVTRYTLGEPAHYSIQSLRLTPPSFDGQRVLSWRVEMPGIDAARCRSATASAIMVHLVTHP